MGQLGLGNISRFGLALLVVLYGYGVVGFAWLMLGGYTVVTAQQALFLPVHEPTRNLLVMIDFCVLPILGVLFATRCETDPVTFVVQSVRDLAA